MSTLQKADGLICVDVFMSYQICQSRFSRHFGPKMNTRKYFAPLNGGLKPDTEEVRELLKESGWIESDSDETLVSDDDNDNDSSYTESSS